MEPVDPIASRSVSTMFVRLLGEAVARSGISVEQLMRGAGLHPALLYDANERIGLRPFCRLLEYGLDATRDEALGLQLAALANESPFGVVAHLLMHAPTLRDMLMLNSRFGKAILDCGPLVLVETGDEALLRYDFVRYSARTDRVFAEFCMLGMLRAVRIYAGPGINPRRVYFPYARPAHHREYARAFAGKACFDQPFAGLAVDRALVDRRQIHSHPKLFSLLHTEAERALARDTSGTEHSDRVMSYLLSRPPHAWPDASSVARELGLSLRTLNRRLKEERTSLRRLRRTAIETAASQLLDDSSRGMKEVARLVGFSDVTAFFRAWKRWKGTTPQQYRARYRRVAG
jgi:AraC-like DNA-binding protein